MPDGNRILLACRPTPPTALRVPTQPEPMLTPAGSKPGASLTLLDTDGPGKISHLWFTISSDEPYHLKRIVLRIYWDGEPTPSVEAPIGDFFGLGLGDYYSWQSELLSVGSENSLNSFFPMPFQRHAGLRSATRASSPSAVFTTTSITRWTPTRCPLARCISMPSIARPNPPWLDKPMDKQWRSTGR